MVGQRANGKRSVDHKSPVENELDADMNDASDDVDDARGGEIDGDICEYDGIVPRPRPGFEVDVEVEAEVELEVEEAVTVAVELELEFEVKLGMLLPPVLDGASFLPAAVPDDDCCCCDPDPDPDASAFRLLLSLICICC